MVTKGEKGNTRLSVRDSGSGSGLALYYGRETSCGDGGDVKNGKAEQKIVELMSYSYNVDITALPTSYDIASRW